MKNKLFSFREAYTVFKDSLNSKSELILIIGLATVLLVTGLIFPKSIAKGDATQDNTSGSWVGNLGPAAVGTASSDVDAKSTQLSINYNSVLTQYEATENTNGSGYYIRSKSISPPVGTIKKWKQLKLGLRKPFGTNTTISVDILCGDQAQCPTLDQPIPGFSNIPLSASDDYDIPTSLTSTNIKIRVNFASVDVTQLQTALYNWQVSWVVNSGVNLTVTKSPNPANPELQGGSYPGVSNNNTVVYTLNYTLDKSVAGLTLELPFPAGTYTPTVGTPKTYTAAYLGSSGGILSGNKVVWNLGNKPSGTVGSVSATFKIQTGPPNGTIFKTKALIWGTDYNLSKTSLPDDLLNIQSKAFASGYVVAPQYIGKSTEVGYVLRLVGGGWYFQSDMFNPRYEFVYSNCLNNTDTNYPKVYGSGLSSWSVDRPNRKITLNLVSPLATTPNLNYTITLKANSTCGATTVAGTLTFYSDQDASFVAQKVSNVTYDGTNPSNWDSTLTPHLSVGKSTWDDPTGAGMRVDYTLRFDQQSTVASTNFYAIDQIPAQTTFIGAQFIPGMRTATGGIANNWKIYWSNKATQPAQTDASWTQLLGGPVPCPSGCTAPVGQEGNVKWIKWEVGSANSFIWDRQENFDQLLGGLSVVTNTTVTGTITNTITGYAGNICQVGCSASRVISSDNKPLFELGYGQSTSSSCASGPGGVGSIVVPSGASFCALSSISNRNGSHGDATDVFYTMRLPDKTYLDPSYDPMALPASEAFALCLRGGSFLNVCPDATGTFQTNPSWLRPYSANCTNGPICTVTWRIPKIYAYYKYPQIEPYQYAFWIQVKTKLGLANQQKICLGNCTLYSITTTPANANTNLPLVTTNEVTIAASVSLNLDITANQATLNCDLSSSVTHTITYYHDGSTGGVNDLYVMDGLPEITDVSPALRLVYAGQSNANAPNTSVYFLTNYSRSGNPPSSDISPAGPGWQPIANVPGQESAVDWVMWKKTAIYTLGPAENAQLTLKDQAGCSPNETVYTNRGFISYDSNASSPATKTALITINNPGFITTTGGNIGSANDIDFPIDVISSNPVISLIGSPQTAKGNGGVSTLSWTHNIDGSVPHNALVVSVSLRGGAPLASVITPCGITFNGVCLTKAIRQTDGGGVGVEIWYLLAPASGLHTVTVNMSGLVGIVAGSSQFDYVDQTTPIGTAVGAQVWGTTPTVAVTTAGGDVVVDVLSKPDGGAGAAEPDASQTKLWSIVEGNAAVRGGSSYKKVSGTTTMSWNVSWENNIIAAVPLKLDTNPPPPPPSNWSKVDYLAISQATVKNLASLKGWLAPSYPGLPNPFSSSSSKIYPNYDKMFADYGRDAVTCADDTSCLKDNIAPNTDSNKIKIYKVGDNSGKPLTINSIPNYSGVPRIVFVDAGSSGGEALNINTNLTIDASSALIFVVKGNVKVNYGVTEVSGVFLVDGQFATGKRVGVSSGVAEAGKFAAISIGRDGFARIAYLSGDNVRFIKCNDLVCQNKNYGYVTPAQSSEVTAINISLYEDANGKDYPKIIVGMKDAIGNVTTKFISCTAENCLDSDPNITTYSDARDPDILINSNTGTPSYAFGAGSGSDRAMSYINCPDKNCPTPPAAATPIDGGAASVNKGNETSFSIDTTLAPDRLIATYADRSTGKSDLWFAKERGAGGGTTCSAVDTWDCKNLATNVDLYPGSVTHPTNGQTFASYVDSVTKEVKYVGCSDKPCSTTLSQTIDCTGGVACLGQPYVSTEIYNTYMYMLYNAKNTTTNDYEVKLAYCNNDWLTCGSSAWTRSSISNNPGNPTVSFTTSGPANSGTQGIALGKVSDVGYPRIAFYADQGSTKNLIYARCKTATCSDIDYKVLDFGSPISLPDKTLTINGSVAAFGNNVPINPPYSANKAIKLERDLYQTSTTQPGEIFKMEPRYFYILKDLIKAPEYIKESPP